MIHSLGTDLYEGTFSKKIGIVYPHPVYELIHSQHLTISYDISFICKCKVILKSGL